MLPKPPTCVGCPLYQDGRGFVPDEIVPDASVFVLGQNPGEDEEEQGRPFVGRTGQVMEKMFFPLAGLQRGQVSIGNAIRCRLLTPSGERTNKLPGKKVLAAALSHCTTAHLHVPAATKLVVSQGALAWQAIGGPGTVTEWRGHLYQLPTFLPVLCTLHVADLFHDPTMQYPTRRDWGRVPHILAGTWPKPVPDANNHEFVFDDAGYVVIDTEYYEDAARNRHVTVMSVLPDNSDHGCLTDLRALPWHGRREFGHLLADLVARTPVVFQNALADIPAIEDTFGIPYSGYARVDDTMLAHAVLWSEWPHDLAFLASLYGQYPKLKHLADTDLALYNWGDVLETRSAWEALRRELDADPLSRKVYETQMLPNIPVCLTTQRVGLCVNKARVQPAIAECIANMREATLLAQAYVGWPININSDNQLRHWLYDIEHLPVQKQPKTKVPTVNKDARAVLRARVYPLPDPGEEETVTAMRTRVADGAHPLLEAVSVFAGNEHTLSAYLSPLVNADGSLVDRAYTQPLPWAQANGRWSWQKPPVAQLPYSLRDIYIPDEGWPWIEWDWDQIELRMQAALARETRLLEAFDKGWDVHTMHACDAFGLPLPPDLTDPSGALANAVWRSQVKWQGKDDIRRVFGKRLVYKDSYGGSEKTAWQVPGAKVLGLSKQELEACVRRLHSARAEYVRWRECLAIQARQAREVRDFYGARRRLFDTELRRLDRVIYDQPLQRGVASIYNLTVAEIHGRWPRLVKKYGMHDSQKWAVPPDMDYADTRQQVMSLVNDHEWDVGGTKVRFPATFK